MSKAPGPYRVLVTDTLADAGLAILRAAEDVDLDYRPGLKGEELLEAVRQCDALISRSGTAVTRELVNAGKRMRIVGRAGVGLDNVDVPAATERGVLVINAPTANILSATEHTMALMLAVCRNLPDANASVKRNEWLRSKFMGIELNGKTLGIIGLGRIGSRVSIRAKAFGMKVIAFDPYIAPTVAEKLGVDFVSFERLLQDSDVITVHTPLTDETRGMIQAADIERMKEGVVLINCARGGIYDEASLAEGLRSGRVAAAAVDVFTEEPPPPDHPLLTAPNIVLTPHIGANTIEAQDRVAIQTSEMVVEALRGSIFVSAVNLPFEGLTDSNAAPLINLSEKIGVFAAQLLNEPAERVSVELWGIDERFLRILSVASLKGLLSQRLSDSVNFVNAESIAENRGIHLSSTIHPTPVDYTNLITLRVGSANDEVCVSGTLFSEKNGRIVAVNNFRVEFRPEGYLLYMVNRDVPGVVGKIGSILGDRDINIAEYNLARNKNANLAMAVVTIDSAPDAETLNFLRSSKEMKDLRLIKL
ncbi:MAG: phosphoglycerate dehydrogenase [Acidobacteriota bacterium]